MGDSSYVRDLQARWSTPSSVVDEIVRRAAHAAADEVARVIQGYQNEVYRVRAGARRLVVRIRHSGEGEFEQEAWAMRQARQAGVPVRPLQDILQVAP
ncbi:phosphotransferase [Actinopolymorpha sp. B9G3]|uniref:phosphotransferase n=1 Tax=Actinopolymorpha sp. B9G3 TaxID=3158970 RepID=UPI0032D98FAD